MKSDKTPMKCAARNTIPTLTTSTFRIDFLKIRGSYGSIGNENVIPQNVSILTGGPSYGPTANSNGYTFNNIFYPGSTVGTAANPALGWEKQLQTNIGFDANFLGNKITLSADYFIKKVDGLLFTPSASLYLGTVPIPVANIGSIKSSGIDLTLGYRETILKKLKLLDDKPVDQTILDPLQKVVSVKLV